MLSDIPIVRHAANSRDIMERAGSGHRECDVHQLHTGELVIRHDRFIGTSKKEAREMSAEEYKTANGGCMFTLPHLMAMHKENAPEGALYIEMKGEGISANKFSKAVLDVIEQHGASKDRMHIFSFQQENINALSRMNAREYTRLGVLFRTVAGFHKGISFGDRTAAHGVLENAAQLEKALNAVTADIDFVGIQDALVISAPKTVADILNNKRADAAIWQINPAPFDTPARNNDMHTAITQLQQHGYNGRITAITDSPASLKQHIQQECHEIRPGYC